MKRLLVLLVVIFALVFTYATIAQELGSLRKGYEISIPEKIQKAVLDPLPAGTYTIGNGGFFPTIDSAFNKLSIDGIAGEVILELIDNLYTAPARQFGFVLNGPIPGAGPTIRITIKPAVNKNVTIEGNNESVLYLVNTSYVTFDGVGITGPTTLTIHALQNPGYVYNDALDFVNNSDHNIIENITFIVEDNTRPSGSGFWYTQTGSAPDSNLIQNNFVKKAGTALFIVSASASLKGKGNVIRENQIGSETDSLISFGIEVSRCENALVENNIVKNLKTTLSGADQLQAGILSEWSSNSIFRNNVLENFGASNGFSASGIFLYGESGNMGSNNQIYNNMIYNIQSTSSQNNSRVAGIEVWNQINPKIYYNSIYLSGTGSQKLGSAALYIGGGNTGVDSKNNILVNTRDESPYYATAIFCNNYSFTQDYNDLYVEPSALNCVVKIGSTKFKTITDWQATGKDFHSTSVLPCFCFPDLHIDCTMATCLEKRGTPIAGLDTDFDGDLRHAYLPDIGADEFAGMIPTGALSFGAYSVGTNGFFSSIESLFNRLSTDGVAGPVTLELTDNLYTAPTTQYGFSLNGPIPGAGPNSRVTIKPATNKNVIVEGNGQNVLSFNNIGYLTLDGVSLSGATSLTVHSLTNTQFLKNNSVGFYDNSDNNVIKNLNVIADDYLRISFAIFIGGGTNLLALPDSNLIENNFIKKAGIAICQSYGTDNIIKHNKIGSETDSLISWGIQSQMTNNTLIENNYVQNLRFGIHYECPGIDSYLDDGCVIRNNIVHNIDGKNARDGAFGIELSGDTGNPGVNNLVYNNMVYDIRSSSNRASGIQLWYVNNSKIYFNTVNLYGTGTGTTTNGSAALYISHSSTNVDAKNNIFVNTRDESPYCASAIYDYSASNLTTDYNDLFYQSNSNNALIRIGNTKYNTLTDWQATGKDLHSVTEMPNFITPDLHIFAGLSYLESRGTPIAGVTLDFDGQPRHATTPDIGADEFNGIVVGIKDEIPLTTEFAMAQNYPNPFNPATTINYQLPVSGKVILKVYDLLGNEIATLVNEEKSAGTYNLTWNAAQLSSGVYFYQLRAGEFISLKKMILLK